MILLIGYLTRLEESEWETRSRHLLRIILDGLRHTEPSNSARNSSGAE